MTNFYYAQIDEQNIVLSILDYPSEVIEPGYIEILSFTSAVVGQKYNKTTNSFFDVVVPVVEVIYRKITVAALYLRLGTKLPELLQLADVLANQGDYALKADLMRIDKLEYFDLDEPTAKPNFLATGKFTSNELDVMFRNATFNEVPEALK